jgi:hypothetical protein
MRILVKMINAVCIEKRATPFYSVHLIALLQQQFR